jgi:hypothetical protein
MILNLLYALALTLIIEGAAAFLMGYRGKRFYSILILMNIMTNPAINYILTLFFLIGPQGMYHFAEVFLEAVVVLVEWRILSYVFPGKAGKMLRLSLVLNASSYLSGLLLFR